MVAGSKYYRYNKLKNGEGVEEMEEMEQKRVGRRRRGRMLYDKETCGSHERGREDIERMRRCADAEGEKVGRW